MFPCNAHCFNITFFNCRGVFQATLLCSVLKKSNQAFDFQSLTDFFFFCHNEAMSVSSLRAPPFHRAKINTNTRLILAPVPIVTMWCRRARRPKVGTQHNLQRDPRPIKSIFYPFQTDFWPRLVCSSAEKVSHH